MDGTTERHQLLLSTSEIVVAHLMNNPCPRSEVSGLINNIYGALAGAQQNAEVLIVEPIISIKNSRTSALLTCLHCGKRCKMLKRHILNAHGETPDEYRATFKLPSDYSMVADDYAERRSAIAKEFGLGTRGKRGRPRGRTKRVA